MSDLSDFARDAVDRLEQVDPDLFDMLQREYERQVDTLALVASCSPEDPSVLACEGTFASNVTAEGYPGRRYHAGCRHVDEFEQLAIDRAKAAFGARYANVQPHTATTANQTVMTSLLDAGDTIIGMDLDAGGHLTHGSKASLSGNYFTSYGYGIRPDGQIDYEQAEALAIEHKPKLIVCGTTAYPRVIDWARFRAIADKVGAWLLADITHIAGLVIAGEHPNSIDHAHVTTTCTHKQLYGPRGGLILLGKDAEMVVPDKNVTLEKLMGKGVFPWFQGAPIVNKIVAKARALGMAMTPEFRERMKRIVELSRGLVAAFEERGVRVVAGGSDNHIVLIDVLSTFDVTGIIAQKALEECGIIVNKNRIAGDTKSIFVSSGVRIGTNSLAARGFTAADMPGVADLICRILEAVEADDDRDYALDAAARDAFADESRGLARRYPIPGYGQRVAH